MKSAYLYVRVSTDEQKKKGFSLIEQEDRLLKHCEINKITVKGIFREDFSAKDFNRPEWKACQSNKEEQATVQNLYLPLSQSGVKITGSAGVTFNQVSQPRIA